MTLNEYYQDYKMTLNLNHQGKLRRGARPRLQTCTCIRRQGIINLTEVLTDRLCKPCGLRRYRCLPRTGNLVRRLHRCPDHQCPSDQLELHPVFAIHGLDLPAHNCLVRQLDHAMHRLTHNLDRHYRRNDLEWELHQVPVDVGVWQAFPW